MKADHRSVDTALQRLLSLTAAQDPRLVPKWPTRLEDLFDNEGLEDVKEHRVEADLYQEFAMHECNLLIYNMIAPRAGSGERAQEILSLIPKAARESKGGAMFAFS